MALLIEKQGRGFPTTSRTSPAKPVFETRLSDSRVTTGNERGLAQLNAVVARLRVGDNLAWILARQDIAGPVQC